MINTMVASHVVQAVDEFGGLLSELLQRAEEVKQATTVEPSLNKSDFSELLGRVESNFFATATTLELRKRYHPAIETAIRDAYNNTLVRKEMDATFGTQSDEP